MSFLSARLNAGLTQSKVAESLGVTDAAVSMWETEKTRPRASLLPKIAALYNCTVDELLKKESITA
jgi:putative transcriptional regulator